MILKKYLQVWLYKLSSRHKKLAFVDGFAGAGKYESGGEEGSPVIAAKWNDDPVLQKKGASLTVHACELDSDSAAELQKNLSRWPSQVYNAPFVDVMPQILELTKNIPTIFFIDPCGTKEIVIPKLQPLLDQKRESLELFVRIDPIMFARFAGWVKKRENGGAKRPAQKKFRELLQQLNVNVDAIEASEDQPEMSELLAQ